MSGELNEMANDRREAILRTLVPSFAAAALIGVGKNANAACNQAPTITSNQYISATDFGTIGDGIADDTCALQAAIDYCSTNGRSLYLKAGAYLVSRTLLKAQSPTVVNMIGDGIRKTIIKSSASLTGPVLKIKGGSGTNAAGAISQISFQGRGDNIAVQVADQCNLTFEYCHFDNCSVGLQLLNESAGGFTEFVRAFACYFGNACVLPMELLGANGAGSFHGCGISGKSVIDSPSFKTSVVKIGNSCFLYNAEFNMQIFAYGELTVFDCLSNQPNYAYGTITLEPYAPVILANNKSFPFAGTVTGISSENINFGTLFICQSVFLSNNSSWSTIGGRYVYKFKAQKANTIPSPLSGAVRQAFIHIACLNYSYRAALIVEHNGFGNPGKYTKIHENFLNNMTGYGAPAFGVNSLGQLTVSNSNYPLNAIDIKYEEVQISPVMP